jgi:hypothetical protein
MMFELTSLEGVAVSSDAGIVDMIGLPLYRKKNEKIVLKQKNTKRIISYFVFVLQLPLTNLRPSGTNKIDLMMQFRWK